MERAYMLRIDYEMDDFIKELQELE